MSRCVVAVVMCFGFGIPCLADAVGVPADGRDKFLHADGSVIRDGKGNAVVLRGVNLGGWLEWQAWMCPMDKSKTLRDDNPGHNGYNFEVRKLLASRFGPVRAEELLNVYRDSWITQADLDNIKALGFNVVRLTFGYDTLMKDDGTWRDDAFVRMDWLVKAAWQRGLYTIVDYHAFLPPGADQDGSAEGYWSNDAQKAETVKIWRRVAEHYRGNPAVAMYDLLNEPINSQPKGKKPPKASVVCDLYDQLYKAIRSVDADHLIAMEGVWDWRTLRDPGKSGYKNVVYSFHWYNFGGKTTADRNKATDGDLKNVENMTQAWNVPTFVGEFNLFGDKDAWKYALSLYNSRKIHWTLWTYKNTAGGSNSWGVYTTIPGKAPPVPNLTTDSAESIAEKWKAWTTSSETFGLNPMFKTLLATGGVIQPAGCPAGPALYRGLGRFVVFVGFDVQVQLVLESVQHGGEQHGRGGEEHDSAEQRIAAGKEFSGAGPERIHLSHAAQDHRSIEKRIQPARALKGVISLHAKAERRGKDSQCDQAIAAEATIKSTAGGQRFVPAVVIHGLSFVGKCCGAFFSLNRHSGRRM